VSSKVAFVLGAGGQVGTAAVSALAADGWRVRAATRRPLPGGLWPAGLDIESVTVDRSSTSGLARALNGGADVLVDCVAYTAAHGRQLLRLGDRIGSAVVMSSVVVYADEQGHGFEDPEGPWPALPVGITEDQPAIPPSDDTGCGRKAGLEQTLLGGPLPVTILRPGAIYGPRSSYPREWYFVKRALDRRPCRILCRGGASRFHTTAAVNLAELIRLAAEQPGSRVLNAGDPDAPTAAQIGAAVSAVLGHRAQEVLIEGEAPPPNIGDTPFSAPRPVVMDMSRAAAQLGYRPLASYAQAIEAAVRWMVDTAAGRDWREAFPYFYANQGDKAFDYRAEDDWLAARR
jgi:nucleoside-diphosphate-sugar epimerase